MSKNLKGTTDEDGLHYIKVKFHGNPDPPVPVSVIAEAEIEDLNGQAIKSSKQMVVHSSKYYVGLHAIESSVRGGKIAVLQIIVTDHGTSHDILT